MPWSTPFDEPVPLRGGRRLATLQQAADYVMGLPEGVQHAPHWQIAVGIVVALALEADFIGLQSSDLNLVTALLEGGALILPATRARLLARLAPVR